MTLGIRKKRGQRMKIWRKKTGGRGHKKTKRKRSTLQKCTSKLRENIKRQKNKQKRGEIKQKNNNNNKNLIKSVRYESLWDSNIFHRNLSIGFSPINL